MKAVATNAEQLYEGDCRLDASYHASDGVKALRLIQQWVDQSSRSAAQATEMLRERAEAYSARRVDALAEVCMPDGVFIPGRFKRIYVDDPDHGERWLLPSDMLKADLSGLRLISRKFTPGIETLRVHQGWILLSRSGTIGNLVYVREDMDRLVGSDDIIRIVADPDKIPPGYLYAFLSSPLGKALLEQKTYGAVVPHIEAHHVTDLPIPRLDPTTEERVHELIERAASLRVEANVLLERAQARLFELNNLSRLTRREALTKGCWYFTIPRSQYGNFALTAWTYNPLTQAAIAQIQAGQNTKLGDLVQPDGIFYGHQFKRIDADPSVGIMLLSQGHVFQERPQGRWISRRSVPDYREYMVPDGAILVAAQGTMGDNELFGRCQFSYRNFEDYMITQHILRVILDSQKVNPGYLFAFLSSEYQYLRKVRL